MAGVKGEPTLVRDSNGFVRLDGTVKMDAKEFKETIEQIYVHAHVNLKAKQLDAPFEEYDRGMSVRRGKTSRPWTDEEEKVVLLSVGEDPETVGKKIGRSGMSVIMRRSWLLDAFESWIEGDGVAYKDKDRKTQVDAFFDLNQEDEE